MAKLSELQNLFHFDTDKQVHDYLTVYDTLFAPYQYASGNLLEIGLLRGGSLSLWSTFFSHMQLVGVDKTKYIGIDALPESIHVIIGDAYTDAMITKLQDQYGSFTLIIDDGPHTTESHLFAIKKYSRLINRGLLILEDVDRFSIPEKLNACWLLDRKFNITIHDRCSGNTSSQWPDSCLIILEFI